MAGWLDALVRSIGVFFLILALARLMGKRAAARPTFFDTTVGIAVGVIGAALSLGLVASSVNGLVVLAVWTLLPLGLYFLAVKYKFVHDLLQGKETLLINHGKVLDDKLSEVRLTSEDLLSQLRRKNIFSFADVEFAILEPTGELTALLKKSKQPLTAKTVGLEVGEERAPQAVILDGNIMDEPLTAMGLNRGWLHTELEKAGVAPENVYLAQVDSLGQLYLDLFNDAISPPQPKAKDLLLATLKKCQADCELYALGTRDPGAKKMYGESSQVLARCTAALEPLMKP